MSEYRIVVYIKRWRDRVYGNNYFSAKIRLIDENNQDIECRIMEIRYDGGAEHEVREYLVSECIIKNYNKAEPWLRCYAEIVDMGFCKKRDMFK